MEEKLMPFYRPFYSVALTKNGHQIRIFGTCHIGPREYFNALFTRVRTHTESGYTLLEERSGIDKLPKKLRGRNLQRLRKACLIYASQSTGLDHQFLTVTRTGLRGRDIDMPFQTRNILEKALGLKDTLLECLMNTDYGNTLDTKVLIDIQTHKHVFVESRNMYMTKQILRETKNCVVLVGQSHLGGMVDILLTCGYTIQETSPYWHESPKQLLENYFTSAFADVQVRLITMLEQ